MAVVLIAGATANVVETLNRAELDIKTGEVKVVVAALVKVEVP